MRLGRELAAAVFNITGDSGEGLCSPRGRGHGRRVLERGKRGQEHHRLVEGYRDGQGRRPRGRTATRPGGDGGNEDDELGLTRNTY